jgi:hypothetical protein
LIARVWKGWTRLEHAEAYEKLLREQVVPSLRKINGHHAAYVLRHDDQKEAEFLVVNFFESWDSVRAFAGEDFTVPVFEPEARKLLSKVEPKAKHYEVRVQAGDLKATPGS